MCQGIHTESVEFSIESRIYYSARRFYSEPGARVIYSHLIGLSINSGIGWADEWATFLAWTCAEP